MGIFPFKEKSPWQNRESNPGSHDHPVGGHFVYLIAGRKQNWGFLERMEACQAEFLEELFVFLRQDALTFVYLVLFHQTAVLWVMDTSFRPREQ
jgi:hypothetical protein